MSASHTRPQPKTTPSRTLSSIALPGRGMGQPPTTIGCWMGSCRKKTCHAIEALPFLPPQEAIFNGKREANNSVRVYFNPENQARFAVCRRIAAGFLDPRVLRAIEEKTGADLSGSRLRIEYCQDTEGFWLAPHTDISVKTFRMLIYLSDDPRLKNAGTDIHEGPPDFKHVASAPYGRNLGFIFVPGKNTWHAVGKRPAPRRGAEIAHRELCHRRHGGRRPSCRSGPLVAMNS